MSAIGLNHFLALGAVLFCLGTYGVLTRRNAIAVLLSLELMFNAVNLNLVAFARFMPNLDGVVLAVFVIAVAAAEVGVGLAIVLMLFRNRRSIDIDAVDQLKG